ncbi:MAG: Mu transposase domain-containing protein, partial [Planctomycetota bacterium]
TSLAVKRVLRGTDREETEAFHGFRGGDPFPADFCAPGKGCEKGSVEGGVAFVRDNVFRPMPEVASLEDLDAAILRELVEDEAERHLPDGRTVAGARRAEREHLRPLPAHEPEACRVLSRVADKFGHVRVDHVHDSLPIVHAYRPATVKLFHDRVEIAVGAERVAVHARRFEKGAKVLEARHVLSLLERKPRAVGEATAIRQWSLPPVFLELRQELAGRTRRPDREWVSILRLLEEHPEEAVEAAVKEAIEKGSPRKESVLALLRRSAEGASPAVAPAAVARPDLAAIEVQAPMLGAYDALAEGVR